MLTFDHFKDALEVEVKNLTCINAISPSTDAKRHLTA